MTGNMAAALQCAYAGAMETPCLIAADGETLTYGGLDMLAARFAARLIELGLKAGGRVVVQVDKSFGNVGLYLGVLRAGGVYVPLNAGYTPAEVAYFLEDAEPDVLVCRPEARGELAPIAEQLGVGAVATMGTDGASGLWADARAGEPLAEIVPRGGGDLAAIVYTSGTTGRSKGAMLTHAAILHNAKALHAHWGFGPGDVLIHALPIFHIHGLFIALHTSLLNATPMIFLDKFDAELVRAKLVDATVLMGVPTFYSRLAALPGFGADDCRAMRVFISGSAPLTAQASDAWTAQTGHRILERYGMSEAGIITSNPLDGVRIAGTVGYPLADTEVRIADADGAELAPGEIGVIEVRSPSLFKGYWRMPEKTAEEIRADGFFITGDNGFMAEDGRVSIVGRAKDLIISGGYNIYPKEIEQVLDDLPGVAESAVIGAPHPEMGEGVVAVLVAEGAPLEDETVAAALAGELARFKHPRRLYWVDALPRNAMGKVQKAALRETYKAAYS
ncbi:MAG: AMP-binding protein [Pseudomonadota bacterium]